MAFFGFVTSGEVLVWANSYRAHLKSPEEIFNFDRFTGFIKEYNRSYNNQTEFVHRFGVFKQTLRDIEIQQKQNPEAIFGVNRFSDLTKDEFIAKYTSPLPPSPDIPISTNESPNRTFAEPIPEAYNWADYKAVSPVKDQAGCGCCYAFAAVAALESQNLIVAGNEFDLSEQQIVDCTQGDPYWNGGCEFGTIAGALKFIQEKGITYEWSYPYTSGYSQKAGVCQTGRNVVSKLYTYEVYSRNEALFLEKLYEVGPLTAEIDARQLKDYKGGILNLPPPVNGYTSNHAILLTGYGLSGVKFWVAKNSWGTGFGENGYLRFARGVNVLNVGKRAYSVRL